MSDAAGWRFRVAMTTSVTWVNGTSMHENRIMYDGCTSTTTVAKLRNLPPGILAFLL